MHYDDLEGFDDFQWRFYRDLADELDDAVSGSFPSTSSTVVNKLSPFEEMLARQDDEEFYEDLQEYAETLAAYEACGNDLEEYDDQVVERLPEEWRKEKYRGYKFVDHRDNSRSLTWLYRQLEEPAEKTETLDGFREYMDEDGSKRLRRFDEEVDDGYERLWRMLRSGDPPLKDHLVAKQEQERMWRADLESRGEELLDRLEEKVGDSIVDGS